MALVAMRSANEPGSPQCCNSDKEEEDEDAMNKNGKSDFFFFNNGAPLDYSLRDAQQPNAERRLSINSSRSTNSIQSNNSDIQQHLQSMFYLLRHEETLKMAVKLESQHENRTRYLVIASRYCQRPAAMDRKYRTAKSNTSASSRMLISSSASQTSNDKNSNKLQHHQQSCDSIENKETVQTSRITNTQNVVEEAIEESCLLGIDCNDCTTLGLVVPILADTTIRLDGDGGFSVKVYDKTYIFKPVSVQAMWSALQTLHKVSQKARENNFYFSGPSHDWLSYYESNIESDQSCLNEWHAMDSLESRRPPSPDAIRNKPTAKEETESIIKMKLKEIMMSVDLDEVTSKYIRSRLEEQLDMDLDEFKEFIDIEMLTILGQMDAPTEIFEHVYLGSEWNASNLEELQKNGVRHILNVTREIDNFFPGMFDYFNVRVYDDEKTNLLKHWDNTFRYITRAKAEGSKVLVHCKMGVSRSASVVIAYAMKAYNWEFQQALQHVKGRRSCIKPNKNFLNQLETYRGMLDAMKNKEKLQRSKSETNLKCTKDGRLLPGSEPTPLIQALNQSKSKSAGYEISSRDSTESRENVNAESNVTNPLELNKGVDKENSSDACAKLTRLRRYMRRSSSSSPKTIQRQSTSILAMSVLKQQSQSLENLTPERSVVDEPKNMRFPGSNGENYSVTQNQVLHIQKNTPPALAARLKTPQSVRTIIHGLESHHNVERKSMKLPFTRSVSHDAAECAESKSAIRAVHDELIGKSEKTETDETDKKHSFNRRTQQFRALHPALNIKLPIDEGSCVETTPSTTTTTTTKIGDNSFNESENKISQRYDLLPSRHASWGSGDTRGPCLPRMRNSSWSDTNRNNNTIFTHNASAASYKNQTNIGVDDHTELMTMRYKTAPIPFFEATLNNTDSNHITTGSSVKRTTLILERHKNRAEYQNDINAIQQDVSQRRKHLYRSSSAVGTTNHHTSNTNQNNTLSTRISDIPSYTMSDIANKNMSAYQSIIVDDDEVALRVGAGVGGGVGATNCTFDEQRISSGNVKVLKRNFEAKAKTKFAENAAYFVTNTTTTNPAVVSSTVGGNTSRKLHHSLPSSPVAQHIDYNIQPMNKYENTDILESSSSINSRTIPVDAGVKGLVHKYQTTATSACGNPLLFSSNVNNTPLTNFKPRPRSYYDVSHKNIQIDNNTAVSSMNPLQHEYNENRPPPVPIKERTEETQMQMQMQIQPKQSQRQNQSTSAVNTCTLSHKRLRQHGKTHPLSRLSLPKEHFNTAAYNTM